MIRFAAICHTCTLLAIGVTGCRITEPLPLPDAAPVSGLVLTANTDNLRIRPGSSGRIRFTLFDKTSQPVPDYPVEFAIQPLSGETATAKLGTPRSLTDARGETVVEIIVGGLAGNDRQAEFWVEATSPGAAPNGARITVTTDAYSVEILPMPADDLVGLATVIAKTRLFFFDNLACSDIDIYGVMSLASQARRAQEVGAWTPVLFLGVAPNGIHAVAAQGLDSAGVVRAGGCVDVPGSALLDDVTIRAPLVVDHLFPSLSGTYRVVSDFQFRSAPTALAPIRSAWQQWSQCPLDPARLWLDCTIAALDPTAKPCGAVTGSLSPLGERLLASRGTTTPSGTPCRSATDANGDPSLDAVVDTLFSARRGQLAEARLATLPQEIDALFANVSLSSQMVFSQAIAPNAYWVEHELLGISFVNANVSFPMSKLALPETKVSSILATAKPRANDLITQVTIAPHGFTLRLGTTSRYAFEASSLLAMRSVSDSAELVGTVFGLAQWNEETGPLTGCAALDAVACARVGEVRGCLLDACRLGLDALTEGLAGAFASLDADDIDFRLGRSAPVIDRNADGQAETLGGLCEAIVGESADGHGMYGYWQGLRQAAAPEGG